MARQILGLQFDVVQSPLLALLGELPNGVGKADVHRRAEVLVRVERFRGRVGHRAPSR